MNHLGPQDVVPRLRSDLNATPPPIGTGAEVIRVGPIGADDVMAMHGFEFSIAQMLDGKRTAVDVIRNCERLGLPMDLRSLEGFLHQLQTHGLISRGQPEREGMAARQRRAWLPATRDLYCEALKSARLGDVAAARRRVEELLWIAPRTAEAVRLKDLLEEGDGGDRTRFQRLFREVEDAWRSEVTPEAPPARVRRSLRPLVVGAFAVALLGALSLVPLPRMVAASARLYPLTETPVVTGLDRDGVVETVAVKEGARVRAGDPLFTWDADDLKIRLAEAKGSLEEARRPMREQLGAEYKPLLGRLHQAENALARAQSALLAGQKDAAGRGSDDVVAHLEADFGRADARVRDLRAQLDAMVKSDVPGALRAEELVKQIAALEAQLGEVTVPAPRAGVVRGLNLKAGQWLGRHEQVMQLDEVDRLKLVAVVLPGFARQIRAGDPVTVRVGSTRVPTAVEAVSDHQLIIPVPNPGSLSPGPLLVDLEFTAASMWTQLR